MAAGIAQAGRLGPKLDQVECIGPEHCPTSQSPLPILRKSDPFFVGADSGPCDSFRYYSRLGRHAFRDRFPPFMQSDLPPFAALEVVGVL
jgi:hypothetical protein